jgi:acetyltransferase-like isoleucine patch superfamily enzyme
LVSALADAVAGLVSIARPAVVPWIRLIRLASLRSRTLGEVPVTTQFDGPVRTAGRVRLRLGQHCRLGHDVFLETQLEGCLDIGHRVRINRGCVLVSYSSIQIGDDCLIGEYVSIRDADHGIQPGGPMRTQPHEHAPIVIGDDVWLARSAVILKGVTIGSGAVVGANSVVTRDVPPMAIVAGCPARFVRWRGRDRASAHRPPLPVDSAADTWP